MCPKKKLVKICDAKMNENDPWKYGWPFDKDIATERRFYECLKKIILGVDSKFFKDKNFLNGDVGMKPMAENTFEFGETTVVIFKEDIVWGVKNREFRTYPEEVAKTINKENKGKYRTGFSFF